MVTFTIFQIRLIVLGYGAKIFLGLFLVSCLNHFQDDKITLGVIGNDTTIQFISIKLKLLYKE